MSTEYLEHANITVANLPEVLRFVQAAMPSWQVRGHGRMDWFGTPIDWLHVGTDTQYLALQGGGQGRQLAWQSHDVGVKHLGLVVPDLDAATERLQQAGFEVDHPGGTHPHRRSRYFQPDACVQFELMQYLSQVPAERNDYAFKP